MTTEQIKKREWLSRAKLLFEQLKKTQKQLLRYQRQKIFLFEIGISDDVLEQKIENNIQKQKKQIKNLIALNEEIRNMILTLHDDTLETILIRYYFLYESYSIIAQKMNYSKRHIQRLFFQAIDKFIVLEAGETT